MVGVGIPEEIKLSPKEWFNVVERAIELVGEDHVALGSDWDGLICTPRDMRTCLELPRLVDALLQLKIAETAIEKILGLNFLRVVKLLRDRS